MRVAVTGTPGTGKTTAVERLATVAPDSRAAALEVVRPAKLVADASARVTGRGVDRGADGTGTESESENEGGSETTGEGQADTALVRGHDPERDSTVIDLDALAVALRDRTDVLIESHLAHHVPDLDRVIVLRCAPARLEARLRERGVPETSITENARAEALDVVLGQAVGRHGRDKVYELDTTDRTPDAVATAVAAVVAGERAPSAGIVDFTEYLV